jgi:hypothetical protein
MPLARKTTLPDFDIDLATRHVRIERACELPDLTDALAEAGYPAQPVAGKI